MFAPVLGELEQISRQLVPAGLDGGQAAALFNDAARAERLCTAIKARLARRVEETKVWRESGHRSAAHWVAEATGETVGAASRTWRRRGRSTRCRTRPPRSGPEWCARPCSAIAA